MTWGDGAVDKRTNSGGEDAGSKLVLLRPHSFFKCRNMPLTHRSLSCKCPQVSHPLA